jgi:phiEco32-like amidoligase-type 2 protein
MAEKTKEKDEPRVYRGELTALKNLVGKRNVIIQWMNRNEPKRDYGIRLPLFGILQEVRDTGGRVTITYFDPRNHFKRTCLSLNAKSEVNVLTGRKGAGIAVEWAAYAKANIGIMAPRYSVTMGADPEIFGVNAEGEVLPAWKWLPPKTKPLKTSHGGDNHRLPGECNAVYWDGFQAEFTTPSATCMAYFADYVHHGLLGVQQALQKHNPKAQLSIKSVLPVPSNELETGKEEHVQFGCMPSFNVYNMAGNKSDGREVPIRFAGGHIHFGVYDKADLKTCLPRVIKAMDSILGVSCVSLFANFDNPVRREWYGLAGEYRTPPHGLEYRVLSNAWLAHPMILNFTYELARRAFDYGWNDVDGWEATETETIDSINGHNVELAHKILERNRPVFEGLLRSCGPFISSADTAFNLVMRGMESGVKDPEDIAGNWQLGEPWVSHCEGPGMNWYKGSLLLKDGKKV